MRRLSFVFVTIVTLSGCVDGEGSREVPVSNRRPSGPSRTSDVTRPAKAIATH